MDTQIYFRYITLLTVLCCPFMLHSFSETTYKKNSSHWLRSLCLWAVFSCSVAALSITQEMIEAVQITVLVMSTEPPPCQKHMIHWHYTNYLVRCVQSHRHTFFCLPQVVLLTQLYNVIYMRITLLSISSVFIISSFNFTVLTINCNSLIVIPSNFIPNFKNCYWFSVLCHVGWLSAL